MEQFITLAPPSGAPTACRLQYGEFAHCGWISTTALATLAPSTTQTSAQLWRPSPHLSSDQDYLTPYLFLAVGVCMFIGRWMRG